MRHLALCLISLSALTACGGSGDDGPPRLGKRADPIALANELEQIADLDPSAIDRVLSEQVFAVCGPGCGCLRSVSDPAVAACPAANSSVPPAWPPLELIGRYLAEQIADAKTVDRSRLLAAVAALRVPIARIDPTQWTLAPSRLHRALSTTRTLITIGGDDQLWAGPMPIARFDATGAHIDDAPGGVVGAATGLAHLDEALTRIRGPRVTDPGAPRDPNRGYGYGFGSVGHGSGSGYGGYSYTRSAAAVGTIEVRLADDAPIVVVSNVASAMRLMEVLSGYGGAIAVRDGDVIGELPITFDTAGTRDPGAAAAELTRTASELVLVSGGETQRWPITSGRYDRAAVQAAVTKAIPGAAPIVALVIRDLTATELIDTVELALGAGAHELRLTAGVTVGGIHARNANGPQVRIGQPASVGDLDKAIIRRYIKRSINKIQYCYEKELLAKPGLEGTIDVKFFIAPSGLVTASNATGFDPAVASCVARVIKAIEFPKPQGGGGVLVNYPFNFVPT